MARAELARYRQEAASAEARVQAGNYQRQLETDGWPPELAAVQARTWYEKQAIERQLSSMAEGAEQGAKNEVARRLSLQFGVDPTVLVGYSTPQAMVAAAQRLGADAKRIAALEAEVAKLRGGTVPAQTFDPNRGGSQGMNYKELLKSGKPLPTAAEIDRMTAQYTK